MTILHIIHNDKFIPHFIDFMQAEFEDFDDHIFYIASGGDKYSITPRDNVVYGDEFGTLKSILELNQYVSRSEKIIIHCLSNMRLVLFLALHPKILKKCCWVLWGDDLYRRVRKTKNMRWYRDELLRRFVIKRLGAITTTVPGDYKVAVNWYKTNASYIENIMYPSHVRRDVVDSHKVDNGVLNIQLGNSASPTNCHKDVIDKLSNNHEDDFVVYCPLSYGDSSYKNDVIAYGNQKLGKRFIPITQFMSFDEYNSYLRKIDIAIMNHNRQQGMGNIIALLGMGKKVYIRSDITPWKYLKNLGFTLFDTLKEIDLSRLDNKIANANSDISKLTFSSERLKRNWISVFNTDWHK